MPLDPLLRPATYGDCQRRGLGTPSRLCPYTSCAYHTTSAPQTCSLRIADAGGLTREETAAVLGVSRRAVAFVEERALAKLRAGRAPTWRAQRERAA